ncbi:MAG: DUF5702 domain-containing protein [Firmicutes bacterium]|nr:DUF5702 domain-containing protein [Bacillota bacterium]
MKKRVHKWINGTKGMIALLLAILMLPFFSLAAVLVESMRYQSAVRMLDEVMGSAAISTLGSYDSYLQSRFGLLAVSGDDKVSTTFTTYMNSMILTDLNGINIDEITAIGTDSLAETEMLRRQILEISALTVPAQLAVDGFQIEEIVKNLEKATSFFPYLSSVKSTASAVGEVSGIAEKFTSAQNACADVKASIEEYNKKFEEWVDDCQALLDHLNTTQPDQKKDAKGYNQWISKKNTLISQANSSKSEYLTAISDLISDLETLENACSDIVEEIASAVSKATTAIADIDTAAYADENKEDEDLVASQKALAEATKSGITDFTGDMQECIDKLDTERMVQAITDLLTEKNAVTDFYASNLAAEDTVPQASVYHFADVDGLGDDSAIVELMEQSTDGLDDMGIVDYIDAVVDMINGLFNLQLFYNAELCGKIDTDYYSSMGGLPSDYVDTTDNYSNAEDEQRSQEYLAEIDPDYDADDPYGLSSGVGGVTVSQIISDMNAVVNAAGDVKDNFSITKFWDFLESLYDLMTSIMDFIDDLVAFLGQIVAAIADILNIYYERALVDGYLIYYVPNRTDYNTGSALNGYSYSKIEYGEIENGELYAIPGLGGIASLIQAISSDGGIANTSFTGAELEYILFGHNSEIGNQAEEFMVLFLIRMLLNLPVLLSNAEIKAYIAAASAVWLGPILTIIIFVGEALIDTAILVNGGTISLIKTQPFMTINGLTMAITKISNLPIDDQDCQKLKGQLMLKSTKFMNKINSEVLDPNSSAYGSGQEGVIDLSYKHYCFLQMLVYSSFTSEDVYLKRFMDIIETEREAYGLDNQSISQSLSGSYVSFDLSKAYVAIRAEVSGSLVEFLPIPGLSSRSIINTDRVIYRGY